MQIIEHTTDIYLERETAVAIGKFDGVHIGHRKLLEELREQKKRGLATCVFTFEPAPAVLFGRSDGKELTTKDEKRALFEELGVDILIEFPLTDKTAAIMPRDFVEEFLVKRMKAQFVAAGSDLSFGNRGEGNAMLLEALGKVHGFQVKTIEKIRLRDREVSSTYIRGLLEQGEMEQVHELLGISYPIAGTVVHGNRIGRTLGFPTVNLLPAVNKLLPPNGVYYSQIQIGEKLYHGITNVGYKPTVSNERICGVESYIYDFSREIYEEDITVYLLAFKRPELQFAGLEALKEQLEKDILDGVSYFRTHCGL